MPKIIELTVEIQVQRVSCPGVWLCQDGKVSLTIYTLGTTYQTCSLPPVFPLMFKDVFYFKKRFQESCLANNICCLLRNENIYCELIQWSDDCVMDKCIILSQYLGNLNDVLFPPNTCSSDGVDLLMRRAKDFPGILSPKIEIATKCRIDEVWHQHGAQSANVQVLTCSCFDGDNRQRQVCHSPQYHKKKCESVAKNRRSHSATRSSDKPTKEYNILVKNAYPSGPSIISTSRPSSPPVNRLSKRKPTNVYNIEAKNVFNWPKNKQDENSWSGNRVDRGCSIHNKDAHQYESRMPRTDNTRRTMGGDRESCADSSGYNKTILDSHYISTERGETNICDKLKHNISFKVEPCVCEICKKYHELFHK